VSSGCLGNGDLRQLCLPYRGQGAGNKRACAHICFPFVCGGFEESAAGLRPNTQYETPNADIDIATGLGLRRAVLAQQPEILTMRLGMPSVRDFLKLQDDFFERLDICRSFPWNPAYPNSAVWNEGSHGANMLRLSGQGSN
jgi:hypothetical protein